VIDATFPAACLDRGDRPPILALVPPREVAPDSSLGFLAAHVLANHGGPGSGYGFGARGIEIGACRSWLGVRQREGRPVLLLATAFALADLVERVAREPALPPAGRRRRSRQAAQEPRRRDLAPGLLARTAMARHLPERVFRVRHDRFLSRLHARARAAIYRCAAARLKARPRPLSPTSCR
jgi:hypothetical protein